MDNSKYCNGTRHGDLTSNGNGSENVTPNRIPSTTASSSQPNYEQPVMINDDEGDDEFCIYTYKGDSRGAADLPSSFFKFDQCDSLSSIEDGCSSGSSHAVRLNYNGIDTFSSASGTVTTHHYNPNGSVVTVSGSRVNSVGRPPNDLFSPDMDFLEMDFDPGGLGDDDDEFSVNRNAPVGDDALVQLLNQFKTENTSTTYCNSNSPFTSTVGENRATINMEELDVTDSPLNGFCTNGNSQLTVPSTETAVDIVETLPNNSILTQSPVSPKPHCSKDMGTHFQQAPHLLNPQLCVGQELWISQEPKRQILMRLVKSNTLPEIRANRMEECTAQLEENEILGVNNTPRITRNSCLSSSAPLIKNESYRAIINTSSKSCAKEDSVEFEIGSIMIWTVEDAFQKSVMQIGTSACGATAICNVLKVLGYDHVDPVYVNSCVKTRLRDLTAEIPEYLFSRSTAGATHEDIINGIAKASNDLVKGRFFQPKVGLEPRAFCKWLLHWICKGAVPVVTRNMQILTSEFHQPIPDAWHHQMIFGISPDSIYMANPIECKSPSLVIPQLTSPSVLLVRRSDVIDRKTPSTDLRKLTTHPDPRWNELNVLGQVANILLEEIPVFSSNSIAKRIRTSHIEIPAAYKGGVTLFLPINSPFYPFLLEAPEL